MPVYADVLVFAGLAAMRRIRLRVLDVVYVCAGEIPGWSALCYCCYYQQSLCRKAACFGAFACTRMPTFNKRKLHVTTNMVPNKLIGIRHVTDRRVGVLILFLKKKLKINCFLEIGHSPRNRKG